MTSRWSRSRRLSLILALSVVVLGRDAGAARTQSPALKMDGYPAPGDTPVVTMITTGAEPKTRLRYAVPKTQTERMAVNVSMAIDVAGMAMPPMQMPAMKQTAELSVTDVTGSGDISYSMVFTGVTIDAPASSDPAAALMMQAMGPALQGLDAAMKTVTGKSTVSDRGEVRSVNLDLSRVTDPMVKQTMEPFSNTMQGLAVPLPAEAVGVGARWEARQSIASGGIQVFQKTTFELTKLEGKTATLKTTVEQTAPPQPMTSTALPAGSDARVQKYSGTGSGTTVIHLDGLVPTSDATMLTTMQVEMNMGGAVQQMTTTTTLKLGVMTVK